MRVAFNASRGSRGASETKKSLQEYASASAGESGRFRSGCEQTNDLAVSLGDATAHVRRIRRDDAALERGDERHRLDDRSRKDRRVEDVGARLAPIARVFQAANEKRRAAISLRST